MVAKEIIKVMVDRDMRKGQLAEKCGWSSSNFYNKIRKDNFLESELLTIADALNCDLEINFIKREEKQ